MKAYKNILKFRNAILLIMITVVFTSCFDKKRKDKIPEEKQELILERGELITKLTFNVLSKSLKMALLKEGVAGAIKYCSVKAYPIVDSVSDAYGATIKRTSLYLRNKDNLPTESEKELLVLYESQLEEGKELTAKVFKQDNETITYYKPIYINTPLCLTCHGKLVETLTDENYKIINQIYPDDEAIGYENEDLRGMWSITFEDY